jgi:Pilus biogenesis CpaD protein (pilus_cpaD)
MKISNKFLPRTVTIALFFLASATLSGCVTDDFADDDLGSSRAYTSSKAENCGQWPEDLTETSSNQHFASHGCAVRTNIATMVADQRTLTTPTKSDPIRAASRVTAIKRLEADTSTSSFRFSFF